MAKPTTTKIPSEMHGRLLRAAKKTRFRKSLLLRLCVEVGLTQVVDKIASLGMKEGRRSLLGIGLLVEDRQLAELRELYKSAVTDVVDGVENLDGKFFVEAVEMALPSHVLHPDHEARVRRFLAIYAQLFPAP